MGYKNNIRQAREQNGLSQKYVALTIGVSAPTVSDWEAQKKNPTVDNLISLANLFHVSTDSLLGLAPLPTVESVWTYDKISEIRRQTGTEVSEVAKALGVTIEEYTRIESGQLPPTVDNLMRLSELYSLDPSYFLGCSWEIVGTKNKDTLSFDENRLIAAFQKAPIEEHEHIIRMVELAAMAAADTISPAAETQETAG